MRSVALNGIGSYFWFLEIRFFFENLDVFEKYNIIIILKCLNPVLSCVVEQEDQELFRMSAVTKDVNDG